MRDFELEKFFSEWEFKAQYNLAASDIESRTVADLLAMVSKDQKAGFEDLWLGYTETWGAPDLRAQIATTYETMEAANILCLSGAQEGIYAAMRVLLSRSDHAIVVVPNYQSAETVPLDICQVSGAPIRAENNWQLDMDDLEKAVRPNTRLISINFPNNPTGALLSQPTLEALIALCRKHDIYLFSDEVYRLVERNPTDRMPQIADIYEKGFSLNVLSKAYGLPGLRIGWIASQDTKNLQSIERYKHFLSICNAGPSERLAMIALEHRETILSRNREIVRRNVQALETFFSSHLDRFSWIPPGGGCVAYPRYIGTDGVESFCKSLIEESGVLLLPSSIYRSELMTAPVDHFRIGFGRDKGFRNGLQAMRQHVAERYCC